jgi:hypothetical protein
MSERGKYERTPFHKFIKTDVWALVFFGYVQGVNDSENPDQSIYKRANDFIDMHPESDLDQSCLLAAYNRLCKIIREQKKI